MLFHVCLGLFMEKCTAPGKLIGSYPSSTLASYFIVHSVVDEAHKYLGNNSEANPSNFVRLLCSIIRQQRHLGARVIVSTQEPTLIPSSILGLLSWIVCHRFQSLSWVDFLGKYVPQPRRQTESSDMLGDGYDWKDRVMSLQTGQALLFSPGTMLLSRNGDVRPLGTGYLKIRIRPRITSDGGVSIFAAGPAVVPQAAIKSKRSTDRSTTGAILTLATEKCGVVSRSFLSNMASLMLPNQIDLTGPSPTHSNVKLPLDLVKHIPAHRNEARNAPKVNGESTDSVVNHTFSDYLSLKSAARSAETAKGVSKYSTPVLDLASLDNSESEKQDRLMRTLPRVRRVVVPISPSEPTLLY